MVGEVVWATVENDGRQGCLAGEAGEPISSKEQVVFLAQKATLAEGVT